MGDREGKAMGEGFRCEGDSSRCFLSLPIPALGVVGLAWKPVNNVPRNPAGADYNRC
jgi:hypothetical protein